MSRLDDELKLAFGRKEPGPDFTERVLRRIAAPPAPKPSRWRSFIDLFRLPKVQWVAVGAAASLLVAILAFQQRAIEQAPHREEPVKEALVPPATGDKSNGAPEIGANKTPAVKAALTNDGAAAIKRNRVARLARGRVHHAARRDQLVAAKGKAAKEKLMLALHIVSSTLGETQRLIGETDSQLKRNDR